MDIKDLKEFHFITPIETIPSILEEGILCHRKANRLNHLDLSMDEIQQRRARKKVPGGKALHEYVNLYFDAHNPMLSKRRDKNNEIRILRIRVEVLYLPDVVLTDRNASSDYVRFYSSPDGLKYLDRDKIFARYWTHSNQFEYMEHKSIKCSEILVPNKLSQEYLLGAYVYNDIGRLALLDAGFPLEIIVNHDLFF